MRITLKKIEIKYEERSFNMRIHMPGQQYATWLWVDYNKWDFICATMDGDRSWNLLKIGDFAITDGVNRLIEFFSDAIRIYDFSNSRGEIFTIPFPFKVLREAIKRRVEEIGEDEVQKIRWQHWPKSKVIWSENIDKAVIYQVREQVLPHIAGLRRIAKNHSDGQLCVVHIYADSRTGQTIEQLEAGEMPSFYWEIVRYRPVPDVPEHLLNIYRKKYRFITHMGKEYMVDDNVIGGSKDYPIYGRFMNGGLIYHPGHGYSVHT